MNKRNKFSRRSFLSQSAALGTLICFAGAKNLQAEETKSGQFSGILGKRKNQVSETGKVYSFSDQARLIFKDIILTPGIVEVGENTEFNVRMSIGPDYSGKPTRLAISLPTQLGFSKPSLFIDEDYGYLEVYCNNPDVSWEKKLWDVQQDFFVDSNTDHPRKWGQHLVIIDVSGGLREDDIIQLNWGDLGRGFGKGTQATVLCPKEYYTQYIWVRYYEDQSEGVPDMERDIPIANFHYRPIPDAESMIPIQILPKPLYRWRLIRKTENALLVPLDIYGNIASVKNFNKEIECKERYLGKSNGVYHYENVNVALQSKNHHLTKSANIGNVFKEYNIYFGDMHNHSAYSNDVIEESRTEMKPYDLQVFARERAGLDFYATSEHHQPCDSPRDQMMQYVWEETIDAIIKNERPGEFLIFPGFEYRCNRGDTVLFFNYLPEYKEINRPEWTDIRKVWDGLIGKDYISHPHLHNPGNLGQDEWWICPYEGIEPVIEIFSCHRSFERSDVFEQGRSLIKQNRKDRFADFFLKNKYRYGFVANSDSHYGHPGMQGLTAVYAKSLEKNSILDAYRKRHVYGVSGDRIRLIFTGNGELMGSELKNTPVKELMIDIVSENKLKKVELFKNGDLYRRFVPDTELTFNRELNIEESQTSNWYVRATQENNQMAWSSAIWYI